MTEMDASWHPAKQYLISCIHCGSAGNPFRTAARGDLTALPEPHLSGFNETAPLLDRWEGKGRERQDRKNGRE